jgi:hypothetical protein
MAGFCKHGNEPSVSIKARSILISCVSTNFLRKAVYQFVFIKLTCLFSIVKATCLDTTPKSIIALQEAGGLGLAPYCRSADGYFLLIFFYFVEYLVT